MRLKTTGKGGNYQRDIARAVRLEPEITEFAHPANFTAERAGGAVAALSAGTVLSRRPPRLGADGLALCDGSADVAAMDRSCRDVAVAAALGGCGRRREILPSPRHRFRALREAIDDAGDGEIVRGGSTITQQIAKNLFLWPGRSVVRKVLEFPLALWIDLVLPKPRILEIYLNIAEFGPAGQFGAQTGSAYAFGHGASVVSAREAALMAAILPNPHVRSARNPSLAVRRLAGTYMARAQAAELQRCWNENRGF